MYDIIITHGALAEWLRSGLQNRVHRFNSGRHLHNLKNHPEQGLFLSPLNYLLRGPDHVTELTNISIYGKI